MDTTKSQLQRAKEALGGGGGSDGGSGGGSGDGSGGGSGGEEGGGEEGGGTPPAPAPTPSPWTEPSAGVYIAGRADAAHQIADANRRQAGSWYHVQSNGDVLFYLLGAENVDVTGNRALTSASALLNPWVPPPKPTEYYTYADSQGIPATAASVFTAEPTTQVDPLAAVLGFTSAHRTQYKIHIVQASTGVLASENPPVVLGESAAKTPPTGFDAGDFRGLFDWGDFEPLGNRVYSIWQKPGSDPELVDELVHSIDLAVGSLGAAGGPPQEPADGLPTLQTGETIISYLNSDKDDGAGTEWLMLTSTPNLDTEATTMRMHFYTTYDDGNAGRPPIN